MAEAKTKPTQMSVAAFIAAAEPAQRSSDAKLVDAMLRRVSGHEPKMWGPSIVGYGSYRYKYESGREGEMCRIGFSPRKNALVFYFAHDFPGYQALMDRLGKYTTGKSCLYVKALADVDMAVLEELARESMVYMDAHYPA